MTRALVPAALFFLLGCSLQGTVDASLREAKEIFAIARPDVDISDARAELWLESTDLVKADAESGGGLTFFAVGTILKEVAPTLIELGILESSSLVDLDALAGFRVDAIQAVTIPAKGVYYIKPANAEDVGIAVHELSHIASRRLNYWDLRKTSLAPGKLLDPAWTDLDAVLALWALEEGTAEATEWAGAAAYWKQRRPVDMSLGNYAKGPVTLRQADGRTISVPPGEWGLLEEYPEPLRRLLGFVYGSSQETVKTRFEPGDSLEAAIRKSWSAFTYATAEILQPEAPPKPSAIAESMRSGRAKLPVGVKGATRVGAYLVRDFLVHRARLDGATGSALARRLQDDMLLRWDDRRALWILKWADAPASAEFSLAYSKTCPGRKVVNEGNLLLISAGTIEDESAAARTLLGN